MFRPRDSPLCQQDVGRLGVKLRRRCKAAGGSIFRLAAKYNAFASQLHSRTCGSQFWECNFHLNSRSNRGRSVRHYVNTESIDVPNNASTALRFLVMERPHKKCGRPQLVSFLSSEFHQSSLEIKNKRSLTCSQVTESLGVILPPRLIITAALGLSTNLFATGNVKSKQAEMSNVDELANGNDERKEDALGCDLVKKP